MTTTTTNTNTTTAAAATTTTTTATTTTTSQNAIELQIQAFQKLRTQHFAKCRQKAFFIHTNISNCSRPQNWAENRALPKTLLNNKNKHSRRIQNFAKCRKKASFIHTNIFKLVHAQNPCTMRPPPKPYFIRATPCQRGFVPNCPVHSINSGLCFYKTELLNHGVGNLWHFGLSCCCHTCPLKWLFS